MYPGESLPRDLATGLLCYPALFPSFPFLFFFGRNVTLQYAGSFLTGLELLNSQEAFLQIYSSLDAEIENKSFCQIQFEANCRCSIPYFILKLSREPTGGAKNAKQPRLCSLLLYFHLVPEACVQLTSSYTAKYILHV